MCCRGSRDSYSRGLGSSSRSSKGSDTGCVEVDITFFTTIIPNEV